MHATREIVAKILDLTHAWLKDGAPGEFRDCVPRDELYSAEPCMNADCVGDDCEELFALMIALSMGAHVHRDRTLTATGEPFFILSIEMAQFLLNRCFVTDLYVLSAAVIHDVLDEAADSDISLATIGRTLPAVTACIVGEMAGTSETVMERAQVTLAETMSTRARIVVGAHMWRSLTYILDTQPTSWSEAHIQGYFRWRYEIFTVIAEDLPGPLNQALTEIFDHGRLKAFGNSPALVSRDVEALERYYRDHSTR